MGYLSYQLVQDFFHQQYVNMKKKVLLFKTLRVHLLASDFEGSSRRTRHEVFGIRQNPWKLIVKKKHNMDIPTILWYLDLWHVICYKSIYLCIYKSFTYSVAFVSLNINLSTALSIWGTIQPTSFVFSAKKRQNAQTFVFSESYGRQITTIQLLQSFAQTIDPFRP